MFRMRSFFLKKGFSLIEVIVSVGILLPAIISLLFIFVYCKSLNESNNNLVTAVVDAQNVLEQIKNLDYLEISNFSPPAFDHLDNQTATVTTSEQGRITEVTINVIWNENQRQRDVSLTTKVVP